LAIDWKRITAEDVERAIQIFETENKQYPKAKNTFLLLNGKKYPAKHIRALAYRAANGVDIPKSSFTGGVETARFFEDLGFSVEYLNVAERSKESIPQDDTCKNEKRTNTASMLTTSTSKESTIMSTKNVIEQKNALQLVLNRYFNSDIVSEKTFDWMLTPKNTYGYSFLIDAIYKYRGKTGFDKGNYRLRCDFVCESQKLIFEYDERQHFTLARKASLESYPDSLSLFFDKQKWIHRCEQINASDNSPPNRDEARAYYDSIRDILSEKNGYKLIRIMHGQYDWESPDADRYIDELLQKDMSHNLPKLELQVPSLRIGLYLQSTDDYLTSINARLKDVSKEKIDIFVFPEFSRTPYDNIFYSLRFSNQQSLDIVINTAIKISKQIGSALIISAQTLDNQIYTLYANNYATDDETRYRFYIKHTMTDNSPLGDVNYKDEIPDLFEPIILKKTKIGMTICFDCNHAAFSRVWGKHNVDIIINSTGGNVVYEKWHRYNKVRALENHCFVFCTMGYTEDNRINSYTFGFTPNGALMVGKPLYPVNTEVDKINNIFIYDTNKCDWRYEPEIRLEQDKSLNRTGTWLLGADINEFNNQLKKAKWIAENLYVLFEKDCNIVLCRAEGKTILSPEIVLKLLYHPLISDIKNKKYLIINNWREHDDDLFRNVISDMLKVRSAENFCAVVYYSSDVNICYQSAYTKNIQVIQEENGFFRLDLKRMSGPEAIWKNKDGMRASWRNGYEILINTL